MAHEKILIIDRDDDLVYAMRLALETAGYKVAHAANGDEGLQMIKQITPDLIILDVGADATAEGFRVSLTLRNPTPASEYVAYQNIPIMMLRAIHSTTALRLAPEQDYLPADSFVEKPIGPERLLEQVRKRIHKK